jgi:cytochrome P450
MNTQRLHSAAVDRKNLVSLTNADSLLALTICSYNQVVNRTQIPPGPAEKYSTTADLLVWMKDHFEQYGDIYKASVYGSNVYVISAPEYAEHVLLKNWQSYLRKGQAVKRIALSLGNGLISSNGEFWVRQRRMIQPAFTRDAIYALTHVMVTASAALLEKWKQAARRRASVNVTRDISLSVLEVTLGSIFGHDYDKVAPDFDIVAKESRNMEFAQTLNSLGKIIVEVATQRRNENSTATDILGMLMQARDREHGRPMPDAQLAREIMTLVIAGHETTASVLNWTWYLLSKHPQVEAKLSSELGNLREGEFPPPESLVKFTYTRQVIDEALRLYPPLWLMTRKALKDDQLGDYFVPAGTEIYISPYLIQRHPQLWEVPDRFDPERFDSDHAQARHRLTMCPFGAGPRNCIGESFALIEMQIHVMTIGRELQLRHAETQPPELEAGVNLLSKHDFIMTPEFKEIHPQAGGPPTPFA